MIGYCKLSFSKHSDLERIQILPQLTRMALARWDQLYDLQAHKRLTATISRELSLNYLNLYEARRQRNL
jgi:hypothetical protein